MFPEHRKISETKRSQSTSKLIKSTTIANNANIELQPKSKSAKNDNQSNEIPHKTFDRNKVREFLKKTQQLRRESLLNEIKKNEEFEAMKKQKLRDLHLKSQQLLQKNVQKRLRKQQQMNDAVGENQEKDSKIVQLVSNSGGDVLQDDNDTKIEPKETNLNCIQDYFKKNSNSLFKQNNYNFMWAMQFKLLSSTKEPQNTDNNNLQINAVSNCSETLTSQSLKLPDVNTKCQNEAETSAAAIISVNNYTKNNISSSINSICENAALKTFEKIIHEQDENSEYFTKILRAKEETVKKDCKQKLLSLESDKKKLKQSDKAADVETLKEKQKKVVMKMQKSVSDIQKLLKVQKNATAQRKNFLVEQYDLMKLQFAVLCPNRNVTKSNDDDATRKKSFGSSLKSKLNCSGSSMKHKEIEDFDNDNLIELLSDKNELSEHLKSLTLEEDINQALNDSELKVEIIEEIEQESSPNDYSMSKRINTVKEHDDRKVSETIVSNDNHMYMNTDNEKVRSETYRNYSSSGRSDRSDRSDRTSISDRSSVSSLLVYESDFHEVNNSWSIFSLIAILVVIVVVVIVVAFFLVTFFFQIHYKI